MIEGAGRIAEGQAQAVDEQAQPLGRGAAAAPTPEQVRAGQGQQQPGEVGPGADGLAEVEEVHAASSSHGMAGQLAEGHRSRISPRRVPPPLFGQSLAVPRYIVPCVLGICSIRDRSIVRSAKGGWP